MTEPNEDEVRRLLSGMAVEAPDPESHAPGIARRARRRMAWTASAGAVGLVVAVTAAAVALPRFLSSERRPVSAPTSSPTASISPVEPERVSLDRRLFLKGTIYAFTNDGLRPLASLPEGRRAVSPPVETPSGFVALVEAGSQTELWIVAAPNERHLLATGVDRGFAVSGNGQRVAYGTADRTGAGVIHLVSLPSGHEIAHSDPMPPLGVGPVGFLGDRVLATTGDASASSVQLWDPSTGEVRDYEWLEVWINASRAVDRRLVVSDGACVIFTYGGPNGEEPPLDRKCVDPFGSFEYSPPLVSAEFSPDGTMVAGIWNSGYSDPVTTSLAVVGFDSKAVAFVKTIPNALQVVWESPSQLLVVVGAPGSGYRVQRCDVAGLRCETVSPYLMTSVEVGIALVARPS